MVSQALFIGREKCVFGKRDNSFCKAIRKLLGIFRTQQTGKLVASAGAIAGEHRHFVPLFIFAAFRKVFLVVLMFQFFIQQQQVWLALPFRRTAADVAVAGAFPGDAHGPLLEISSASGARGLKMIKE